MTVPTHNLYDFVHQVLENKFHLHYFYPYGSKNLENLILYDFFNFEGKKKFTKFDKILNILTQKENICLKIFPKKLINNQVYCNFNTQLICNDQEPLDFVFYQNPYMHVQLVKQVSDTTLPGVITTLKNFRWKFPSNRQKYAIVLHSEINSKQVDLYNNSGQFVCAYWWSHAVIALDWYRFAKHDRFLNPASNLKKTFLFYCRDTTGSRQYRASLLDQINQAKIEECQIGSFDNHKIITSGSSAEYHVQDINQSGIQVVAETVFDERIHLTEKTLRPIACGQPFILAAGPGSLQYLKSYGYKTFSPWINEDYDNELDSTKRLQMIVKEMKRIESLSDLDKTFIIWQCLKISKYNKKLFFSDAFFNQVKNELITNVKKAEELVKNEFDWKFMWNFRQAHKKQCRNSYKANPRNYYEMKFIRHLKKGGTIEDYEPPFEN